MKKIYRLTLLLTTIFMFGISHNAQSQHLNSTSVGLGLDGDFGFGSTNIGIPLEVRFGSTKNVFNILIGERFSYHLGGNDEEDYWDAYYNGWLSKPTYSYIQFSTYIHGRINLWHSAGSSVFIGAGYYFNVNNAGRIHIEAPHVSYINGVATYTGTNEHSYRCSDLIHEISHSARFELGWSMEIIEFTGFLSFELTPSINKTTLEYDIYYDPNFMDHNIQLYPTSGYNPINMASIEEIDNAMNDRIFFGIGLKFYMGTGYLNKH